MALMSGKKVLTEEEKSMIVAAFLSGMYYVTHEPPNDEDIGEDEETGDPCVTSYLAKFIGESYADMHVRVLAMVERIHAQVEAGK